MRSLKHLLIAAVVVALGGSAYAELQNVCVGGSLRIRGSYYTTPANFDGTFRNRNQAVQPWWFNNNAINGAGVNAAGVLGPLAPANPLNAFRSPGIPFFGLGLPFRPLGNRSNFVLGGTNFTEDGESLSFVEQRTTLSVLADFTNDVSVFIELDSYDIWGEDFRSNYITGADFSSTTAEDVEVYQAYVEANEMFGYPLRLRVGRQEMSLGSEWLVGVNNGSSFYFGLSFDAVRLTYATDMFSVDVFGSKLVDTSPIEEDGDVDLYGIYGSYLGIEDITIDAYWLYLRDARARKDTQFGLVGEAVEDLFNVDNYDATNLHTIGLRGAGVYGAFDFESEIAYQFGSADAFGFQFTRGIYGDDEAEFDNFGGNLEVGYTFDMTYTPRVYLGVAYFEGEDNRDITFGEWLWAQFNPFFEGEASVSFNRLFSNWEYTEFFANTDLSNSWIFRGGISANPTEQVSVLLAASHFIADEPFADTPDVQLFGNRVTWFSPLSWIDEEHDDTLGTEVGLYVTYEYSEDLTFEVGWAHLFVGEGLEEGSYQGLNGTFFLGGRDSFDSEDADYVYIETSISF